MTLEEAKELMRSNNIPFELREFQNEKEYWHHVTLFPYTQNAKPCKVLAMVIRSNNGKKDIELQFNASGDSFHFEELHFGDFGYEMFGCASELLDRINEIKSGSFTVIIANDIKKKRWLGDACFDLSDDDAFDKPGFEKTMKRIQKPKGFASKLIKSKKQFEIYDWNTYQCIVK